MARTKSLYLLNRLMQKLNSRRECSSDAGHLLANQLEIKAKHWHSSSGTASIFIIANPSCLLLCRTKWSSEAEHYFEPSLLILTILKTLLSTSFSHFYSHYINAILRKFHSYNFRHHFCQPVSYLSAYFFFWSNFSLTYFHFFLFYSLILMLEEI